MSIIEGIVLLGFLAGMIYTMVRFGMKDIHKDLQDIRGEISKINTRLDRAEQRIDDVYKEITRLYQTCIEMLGTRHKQ